MKDQILSIYLIYTLHSKRTTRIEFFLTSVLIVYNFSAQETIKAVVARYNPDQLITQREKVSQEIKQILVTKAKEFNIILDDVAILHIEFSKEFRDAIEAKQVSQQMAERYIKLLSQS